MPVIVGVVGLSPIKHPPHHTMPFTFHTFPDHFLTLIPEVHALSMALSFRPVTKLYGFLRAHVDPPSIFPPIYVDFTLVEHFIVAPMPAYKSPHSSLIIHRIGTFVDKTNLLLLHSSIDDGDGLFFEVALHHVF